MCDTPCVPKCTTVKTFMVLMLLLMIFQLTVNNEELIYSYFTLPRQKSLSEPPFKFTQIRPLRQLPVECDLNNTSDILKTSRTIPPTYPCNGTGQTVNISGQFKLDVFNSFCHTSNETLRAILPVYSAPDYYERRRAIRETVGKECRHFQCKVFFIIGVSVNPNVNEAVRQEYNNNKDILIIDKMDTYRDLNNKVVAMLDWLVAYCPQPKYVIHFIDDTYPNIRTFLEQLDTINANKYMLGRFNSAPPVRSKKSKWYISEEEYPYTRYPTYIVGVAYAFLNSDCKLLREYVHKTEYNWVEDVWLTGFVAKAAGFKLTRFKKACPNGLSKMDVATWNKNVCIHMVSAKDYYKIFAVAAQSYR